MGNEDIGAPLHHVDIAAGICAFRGQIANLCQRQSNKRFTDSIIYIANVNLQMFDGILHNHFTNHDFMVKTNKKYNKGGDR